MASSRILLRVLVLGISVSMLACGSPSVSDGPTDASATDVGAIDAGATDAGATDGGTDVEVIDAGATDGGDVVVPGKVSLSVLAAKERSSVDGVSAAAGKLFAVVELTLANDLSSAVTISPATFRLRTGDGLEVLASPSAMQIANVCPSDAFLSAGRSISCVVGFEISRSAAPDALLYVGVVDGGEPGAIRAEAPIASFEPCTRCEDVCVDLMTDVRHCGACGFKACDRCQDGVPLCNGDYACIEEVCVDPAIEAMLRTSTASVSCDALCSAEGKTCKTMFPMDGDPLERPLVVYWFEDGREGVFSIKCPEVPPAIYHNWRLKEVRCACR